MPDLNICPCCGQTVAHDWRLAVRLIMTQNARSRMKSGEIMRHLELMGVAIDRMSLYRYLISLETGGLASRNPQKPNSGWKWVA